MLYIGRNPDNTQKETLGFIFTEEEVHDIIRCMRTSTLKLLQTNDTDPIALRYDQLATDLHRIIVSNT